MVEEAYRAALLGVSPHPSLLGKVTDRAFRKFVDDMLQLLARYSHSHSMPLNTIEHGITRLPRQCLLALIADLVSNASSSSDVAQRRSRYLREPKAVGHSAHSDPRQRREKIGTSQPTVALPLQRRFASALLHQKRKRWPYSPFEGRTFRPGFKYSEFVAVQHLGAGTGPPGSKSGI